MRAGQCENIQNTEDVPQVSTSILSEQELQASVGERGTIPSGINLNPQQPVTANAEIGDTSKDSQRSPMCANSTSMCKESIYEDDSKYRLKSNDEFKLVTNKRFKKSYKGKVKDSCVTHTF
jgi:hypothetical protein